MKLPLRDGVKCDAVGGDAQMVRLRQRVGEEERPRAAALGQLRRRVTIAATSPRAEGDLAGGIRSVAGLAGHAEDELIDAVALDPGVLQGGRDGRAAELHGGHRGESASVAADGRAAG